MNRLYAYQGNIPSFKALALSKRATKTAVAPVLIAMILFQLACPFSGPSINILKSAVAAFKPFIDYEVKQGHFTADKAKLYTDDANLLIDDFGQLSTAFGAATTFAQKGDAVSAFVGKVAPIVNDFANIPQLNTALLIFNTALAVVEAFYQGQPPKLAPGAPRVQVPSSEAELKVYMKEEAAKLKVALAH